MAGDRGWNPRKSLFLVDNCRKKRYIEPGQFHTRMKASGETAKAAAPKTKAAPTAKKPAAKPSAKKS